MALPPRMAYPDIVDEGFARRVSASSARNDGRDDSGICLHAMSVSRIFWARDSYSGLRPPVWCFLVPASSAGLSCSMLSRS
jgi:hypothetical protein